MNLKEIMGINNSSNNDTAKKKPEPAEKYLSLRPAVRYTPERGGFYGWLYRADPNLYQGKVVIVLTGSDGYFSVAKLIAEQFTKSRINAMALAYWNQPGQPEEMKEVPLDPIETAAERMKSLGMNKVILWGISLGAVAALNVAARRPDLISGVVAVSAIDFNQQSIAKENGALADKSVFTWHGEPLPYQKLSYSKNRIIKDCIRHLEYRLLSCYEDTAQQISEDDFYIPVEKIGGPVLCITAKEDTVWPSDFCSERMMKRLDEKNFPYEHKHLTYEYATHFLLAFGTSYANMFRIYRKYTKKCEESGRQAHYQTMTFINQI